MIPRHVIVHPERLDWMRRAFDRCLTAEERYEAPPEFTVAYVGVVVDDPRPRPAWSVPRGMGSDRLLFDGILDGEPPWRTDNLPVPGLDEDLIEAMMDPIPVVALPPMGSLSWLPEPSAIEFRTGIEQYPSIKEKP